MCNKNVIPSKEIVEQLRKQYPAGMIVVLDDVDDCQAPETGSLGKVIAVDDIGTIHVEWLNGGGLGICYDHDRCHAASPEEVAIYKIGLEAKRQHDGSRCPRCGLVMQGVLHRHALSRKAKIIICDQCGQDEALEEAARAGVLKTDKPFMKIEDWYICSQEVE